MPPEPSNAKLPLLKFRPVLKRIRWGGRRLGNVLGKPLGDETDYAESWEVSCHEDGLSVIDGGPFDGRTLKSLVAQQPGLLLGAARQSDAFPLLIKFLDANDRLSVQVQPNDEQAVQFQPGENGKTEAWVILDARPDSRLYAGLQQNVDRDRLRQGLNDGTVEACLHSFPVSAGDCIFIPAGTVHAIGEGILLAEIQQSSNLTFRLYDWGRTGADGKPRPLHIEEALQCIDFHRGPVNPVTPQVLSTEEPQTEELVRCPYFVLRRHTAEQPFPLPDRDSFRVLMALRGSANVSHREGEETLSFGNSLLIPACCRDIEIRPHREGPSIILETFLPGDQVTG